MFLVIYFLPKFVFSAQEWLLFCSLQDFCPIGGWSWPRANQATTYIIRLMQIQDTEGINLKTRGRGNPVCSVMPSRLRSIASWRGFPQKTGTQSKVPRSHTKERCAWKRSVGLKETMCLVINRDCSLTVKEPTSHRLGIQESGSLKDGRSKE